MEDMNTIISVISTVGFPIICVVFLWDFVNKTLKEFTETMKENTLMLQKLYEKIDYLDGDKNEK